MNHEKWIKLPPEEQNFLVALCRGFKPFYCGDGTNRKPELLYMAGEHNLKKVPDHLNDLNAMHEAEKIFVPKERTIEELEREILYTKNLERVMEHDLSFRKYHATAAQRAEAFVLTMTQGKEKENDA